MKNCIVKNMKQEKYENFMNMNIFMRSDSFIDNK